MCPQKGFDDTLSDEECVVMIASYAKPPGRDAFREEMRIIRVCLGVAIAADNVGGGAHCLQTQRCSLLFSPLTIAQGRASLHFAFMGNPLTR